MEDFFPDFDGPIEELDDHLLPVLAIEGQAPRDEHGTLIPSELDYLLEERLGISDDDELSIWRFYIFVVAAERQRAKARRFDQLADGNKAGSAAM
jgi:hypothetical protein